MSELSATRKAGLWVGIVFLLGAALGATIGYSYEHHRVSAANTPLTEPARRAQRIEQMTRDFSLTPDQAKQLDPILLKWHAEVKDVHDKSDAQIEQLRQRGRDQIRAILTPDQKPKFEDFLKQLDEQRKRNGPPGGH